MVNHVKRERLSAFLDGQLPREEREEINDHLNACFECRREMEGLTRVSELLASVEDVEGSPYFVAQLKRRISEERTAPSLLSGIVEWTRGMRVARLAVPAGASLLLVVSIVVGSHLGSTIHQQQTENAMQLATQFDESLSLTSFDDFPDGSLGEAYGSLYADGGE